MIREIPILSIRKKSSPIHRPPSIGTTHKRNRSNKQYSARLTRWLDRLTHFDISIQHIAGSNLKFTDYLSRNPVGGAIPEENYNQEYAINILTEQVEFDLEYGQLFANQSESSKIKAETENGTSEEQNEIIDNQSHSKRTFEKDYGVNKIQQSENNTSGQSDISTQSSCCLPKETLKFVQNNSGTDPSQKQHAERRPRNNSGWISDSFRQAVN